MSIRRINDVYVANSARVMGNVKLGTNVNLWYGVVIRGDVAPITVGSGTNVQDNSVIHCEYDRPNSIGANVTIGHGAIVHGDAIGDGSMVGMGAILLGNSVIGQGCLIAAGAVVSPGMEVPDSMVVMGVPGKIVRPVTEEEQQMLRHIPLQYVEGAEAYVAGEEARVQPWDQPVS